MSDETTLLPCPFCGGKGELFSIVPTYDGFWSCACRDCGACTSFGSEAETIAAWNTRAAHGTLTSEQVRKAIMSADRWEKPMGNTGLTNTHLIIRDDGWQAIADELNAELGSGICENVDKYPSFRFTCSECGCRVYYEDYDGEPYMFVGECAEVPRFCPNCGKKVNR